MKTKNLTNSLMILISIIITIIFSACSHNKEQNVKKEVAVGKTDEIYEVGKPMEYIPTKIGTILTYEITLGEVNPLHYQEIMWPNGDLIIMTISRGLYWGAMDSKNKKTTFILQMEIKGPVANPAGIKCSQGIELSIKKDELGIYDYAKAVFWGIYDEEQFSWSEIIDFPPNIPGAPHDQWNYNADGHCQKLIFFENKPGTEMHYKTSDESLVYNGVIKTPKANGLSFTRIISSSKDKKKTDHLSEGFKEEQIFEKGRGLIYLKQTIGGKTSMTWTRID